MIFRLRLSDDAAITLKELELDHSKKRILKDHDFTHHSTSLTPHCKQSHCNIAQH